jgi:hypothetical protein
MKTNVESEDVLKEALMLVFEMNGHEGVEEYAKVHGIELDFCRELLEAELTGSEPKPAP